MIKYTVLIVDTKVIITTRRIFAESKRPEKPFHSRSAFASVYGNKVVLPSWRQNLSPFLTCTPDQIIAEASPNKASLWAIAFAALGFSIGRDIGLVAGIFVGYTIGNSFHHHEEKICKEFNESKWPPADLFNY
jgi:hypothetical protein